MSTKKLAKELGLLRQRSQSSSGSKKVLLSNQIFSHLIVIDFESTCWREKSNYSQEIIEFPAVLLNTSTGEIESEFHTYVQPQEHPILSSFCSELTGITQMQVEAGIPLQMCLSRFNRWLQNLQLELGVVFPRRQQIYTAPSPSQRLCTFLTWSGLDDSRNTAKLAARMMRDGCVMKITRSLERAPSLVKPVFGNVTVDKKENPNAVEKANPLETNNPSSFKFALASRQTKPCSENSTRKVDARDDSNSLRDSSCQSLISPKTLLNGSVLPLWGDNSSKSVKTVGVTHLSSSVRINCPPHNELSSLVLCSTTVGGLSNGPQPNQLSETAVTVSHTEEEECGELLMEPEERCCSYDDVVLDGDDAESISGFDSGCYVCEEPDISDSTGDLFKLKANINAVPNSKPEIMSSELPTTLMRSHVNIIDGSDKMRQRSAISKPDAYFAVPKTVSWGSRTNQQKTGLKTVQQFRGMSAGSPKMPETNTSSTLRSKSFVPGKTSTPNTTFARPKPVIKPHTKLKEAPKSSFTIYADQTKQLAAPSHPSSVSCLDTKDVLTTLSTNTTFPLVKLKEGGKITSPLCACGRRAKRQVVSNGGPNHGRGFYCCPVRRSGSGGRIQKRCEFFKWESSLMKTNAAASSVSLCQFNSTVHCCPKQSSTLRKSY
ncbi:ERI1 exoribonuclease 2 [Channa argus]|uniref:ERI1 exoribonuclease 2 n=1 Tax=Channa argus TaxID=215402 RepID=A0A6G1PCI8_CHAAH|nr:ERI1 exoribonuclease 2 [Channa argus]